MWPLFTAVAETSAVRGGVTAVSRFWPSIVSGAKTAGSAALGFLGFGELGAAAGAAATGGSKAAKITKAAVAGTAAAVYDGKINISPGDTGVFENLFHMPDFLTNSKTGASQNIATSGSMFADTTQKQVLPLWLKVAIGGAVVLGSVVLIKGVIK